MFDGLDSSLWVLNRLRYFFHPVRSVRRIGLESLGARVKDRNKYLLLAHFREVASLGKDGTPPVVSLIALTARLVIAQVGLQAARHRPHKLMFNFGGGGLFRHVSIL